MVAAGADGTGAGADGALLGGAAGAEGVAGALAAGAGRRDVDATGLRVGIGSAGGSGLGAAAGFSAAGSAGFSATGSAAFAGVGAEGATSGLAFAGAAGLRSTLRTRSAMLSGTTLSWFFASKTPPKRSLKRLISSLEVSPTSFASSNIRTFPVAKFCLSNSRRDDSLGAQSRGCLLLPSGHNRRSSPTRPRAFGVLSIALVQHVSFKIIIKPLA